MCVTSFMHSTCLCLSGLTLSHMEPITMSPGAVNIPIPGTSDPLHVMTTDTDLDADSDSESGDREYKEDSLLTGAHQDRKVPLSLPGSLLQGQWKKWKSSARSGYSPLAQARKEDTHFSPCSDAQKFWSMHCSGPDG